MRCNNKLIFDHLALHIVLLIIASPPRHAQPQ